MRLGFLGGTFNPIHFGHLRAAEEVRQMAGLDRVTYVVAAKPPHKDEPELTGVRHRLAMAKLAAADNPAFAVSDVEARRTGRSYTVDTLVELDRTKAPGDDLFFLVGLDAFYDIGAWHEHQRLFELANFIVFSRPGQSPLGFDSRLRKSIDPNFRYDSQSHLYRHTSGMTLEFLTVTYLDISASDIRDRVRKKTSIAYLVPAAVDKYIRQHHLYQDDPA